MHTTDREPPRGLEPHSKKAWKKKKMMKMKKNKKKKKQSLRLRMLMLMRSGQKPRGARRRATSTKRLQKGYHRPLAPR